MRILFSIFLIISFITCSKNKEFTVENGLLEIPSDFLNHQNLDLSGNWKVIWGEFVSPEDNFPVNSDLIYIPSVWNSNSKKIEKFGKDGLGWASFYMKLKLDKDTGLALSILTFGTNGKIFVNKKLIYEVGMIGKNQSESKPDYSPATIFLDKSINNEYEFLVQVSNFHHGKGGFWYPLRIGEKNLILKEKIKNTYLEFFLIGSIFIMGIYHIGLYFLRKQDKYAIYFGIFCLIISIRTSLTGEYSFYDLIPNFSWFLSIRFEFLTISFGNLFFALYFFSIFKNKQIRFFNLFIYFISIISIIGFALFPTTFVSKFQILINLNILITVFYIIYLSIFAILEKESGAKTFIIGIILFTATIINDILYTNQMIQSEYLGHYGFFVFIFSQAFLLSARFSKAFNTVESLSNELAKAKDFLENKVMERTESLQKAIEAISEANKLKDKFLSVVSHDIRSPLSSLSMTLEYLLEEDVSKESNMEMLNFSKQNVERLLKMVTEILSYARLQTGKILPLYENKNLFNEVEETIQKVELTAKDKKIKIQNFIPKEKMFASDYKLLQIILNNLLGNALKFSHQGSYVNINFQETDQELFIEVEDFGKGMSQSKINTLFNSQTNQSEIGTFGERGSGFGLPFCFEMIQSLDGKLSVESTLNKGSKFIIQLPNFNKSILLINDNSKEREEWKKQLPEFNFIEKDSGQSGIEQIEIFNPDLILIDYFLIGGNGLDIAIKLLTKNQRISQIYVFISKDEFTLDLKNELIERRIPEKIKIIRTLNEIN